MSIHSFQEKYKVVRQHVHEKKKIYMKYCKNKKKRRGKRKKIQGFGKSLYICGIESKIFFDYTKEQMCREGRNRRIENEDFGRKRIMASLSLQHITKMYPNGLEAVKDVSLEIDDREFIVFAGPLGCGKSTLLRMIAGLEEISSGVIKIGDTVVNDTDTKDRDVAMIFQTYKLYPDMTVYENMEFGLKRQKIPQEVIDERIQEAAEILKIEKLLGCKPEELSEGQKHRVAVGRTIVRCPKVFLMDEPLVNLEKKLGDTVRKEILTMHRRLNTTTIYVTSDQEEAMQLGSKIVVMQDGMIQQIGSAQELYEKPSNLFVAGFIGSPEMNFLDARLHVCEKEWKLEIGSSLVSIPEQKAKKALEKAYGEKNVILGIRPEDVCVIADGDKADKERMIETAAVSCEPAKQEGYLKIETEELEITAKAGAVSDIEKGDKIRLYLNMEKAHLFDKETGQSISD